MFHLNHRVDHWLGLTCALALSIQCSTLCAQSILNEADESPSNVITDIANPPIVDQVRFPNPLHNRRELHGSTDGSRANPNADHRFAKFLDRLGEACGPRFDFYGYLGQGFTWNPDNPANRTNGLVLNNYRSNDYLLNAIYLVSERKIDPQLQVLQLGGRFDTVYGTDALFMQTIGLDENIVTPAASRFYKLAFRQAYLNLFLPIGRGASVKIGTFVTPIGNETGYAPTNFFYSSLLVDNIQPGTLTGFLAQYPLTDNLHVSFGPNLGWSAFENINHAISYAGEITWTSTDKRTQIQFDFQDGKQRTEISSGDAFTEVASGDALVVYYSLILDRKLGDNWHYIMEHDLMTSNSRSGISEDNFQCYSLANYLIYQINSQWRSAIRVGWLQNDGGRLSGVNPIPLAASGNFYDITFGFNWQPRHDLRIRPELRYDWQSRDPNSSLPPSYDDYTSVKQWLIACDILLEF